MKKQTRIDKLNQAKLKTTFYVRKYVYKVRIL